MHVPQLLAGGGRGTICGLANVMPRLMRAMFDAPNLFERLLRVEQFYPAPRQLLCTPRFAAVDRQPEVAAAMLAVRYRVFRNRGNLNHHVGLNNYLSLPNKIFESVAAGRRARHAGRV